MLDFGVVHLAVHMHPLNLLKFWLMKKSFLKKCIFTLLFLSVCMSVRYHEGSIL